MNGNFGRFPLGGVLVIAVLSIGGGALNASSDVRGAEPSMAPANSETVITHSAWAVDISDDRILMGVASHAFVGRVIEQASAEGVPVANAAFEIPQTQFTVEVLSAVKGELPQRVIVSQYSGYDNETGQLVLRDGDPLLRPGQIAFFATRHEKDTDFYKITGAGYGAVRLDTLTEQAAVLARFTAAAANEVDVDALLQAAAEMPAEESQVRAERDRDDRDERKRDRRNREKRDR